MHFHGFSVSPLFSLEAEKRANRKKSCADSFMDEQHQDPQGTVVAMPQRRQKPLLGFENSALLIATIMTVCRSTRRGALQYIHQTVVAGIIGTRVPKAIPVAQHALEWSDVRAYAYMRFTVPQLESIAALLGLLEMVMTGSGDRVSRLEALAVVCRLAEPCRWYVIEAEFWRSRASLSRIFWATVALVISRLADKFHASLLRTRVEPSCAAVRRHGALRITKNHIARPSPGKIHRGLSAAIFSGYKRRHCMTWQAVSTPDGLCVALHGPTEGAKHDSTVLKESGIIQRMVQDNCFSGKLICGDAGRSVSDFIALRFKPDSLSACSQLTDGQQALDC